MHCTGECNEASITSEQHFGHQAGTGSQYLFISLSHGIKISCDIQMHSIQPVEAKILMHVLVSHAHATWRGGRGLSYEVVWAF